MSATTETALDRWDAGAAKLAQGVTNGQAQGAIPAYARLLALLLMQRRVAFTALTGPEGKRWRAALDAEFVRIWESIQPVQRERDERYDAVQALRNAYHAYAGGLVVLMAEHVGEPAWKGLVARLRAVSPEFADLWARHDVQGVENKSKRFRNPLVGMLKLDATNTWLAPRVGTRLQVYTPRDADTERKLGTLLERIEAGD